MLRAQLQKDLVKTHRTCRNMNIEPPKVELAMSLADKLDAELSGAPGHGTS